MCGLFKKKDDGAPKLFKCTWCKVKKARQEFTLFSAVKICTSCAEAAASNKMDEKILGKNLSGFISKGELRAKLKKKGYSDEDIEMGLKKTGFNK